MREQSIFTLPCGRGSELVGKKRNGDIEAEGFRVEREGLPLTVWADPKTNKLVLVEMSLLLAKAKK